MSNREPNKKLVGPWRTVHAGHLAGGNLHISLPRPVVVARDVIFRWQSVRSMRSIATARTQCI